MSEDLFKTGYFIRKVKNDPNKSCNFSRLVLIPFSGSRELILSQLLLFEPIGVSKANVIRMGLEKNHREREVRDLMYSVSQAVKQKYM